MDGAMGAFGLIISFFGIVGAVTVFLFNPFRDINRRPSLSGLLFISMIFGGILMVGITKNEMREEAAKNKKSAGDCYVLSGTMILVNKGESLATACLLKDGSYFLVNTGE